MLEIVRSGHAGRLAGELGAWLASHPLPDPIAAEPVVVHSGGMARWLSHVLAEQLGAQEGGDGVCANVAFRFPAQIVREVVTACTGRPPPDEDPWLPDRLVWSVLDVLPGLLDEPPFAALRAYLDPPVPAHRRGWALARRVADLFDRYAVYRPEMALAWGAGDDVGPHGRAIDPRHAWQPRLWREVEQRLEVQSLAARFAETRRILTDGEPAAPLPPRVTFFGTGALPPAFIELLVALAGRTEVRLHLVVPSDVLWSRIAGARDHLRDADAAVDPGDLGIEAVNPLLTADGRLGRDFQVTLERLAPGYHETVIDGPVEDAAGRSMLGVLRADIVADRHRGRPGGADERVEVAEGDRSVQVHACHSPLRQVEVLRDVLLGLLDDDPEIEPRDILVMTPDVERYAPLVRAVFGADAATSGEPDGPPPLPVRVSDRTLVRVNPAADALLALLEAVDSRVEASRVLDLVGREPVRRRFGISMPELERIEGWVAAAGIRWGVDEHHRERQGQPADRWHTWRFGLDRLLLGVALADEDDRTVGEVTPFDDMEGDDVDLLGRFVRMCEVLFTTLDELREPRPLGDWAVALPEAVSRLVDAAEDDRWQLTQVQDAIDGLVGVTQGEAAAELAIPIELPALRAALGRALEQPSGTVGYETGAITFSAMIPLRSIPRRVVCLIGMDDDTFPRKARPAGFDLIAAERRTGDRDPRDEDRYLFLEALLSASRHLVVTYTGRDQRSNEPLPPAVPVGELLDVVDRSFVGARDVVVREHPLQAFSPKNFVLSADEPEPFSFQPDALEAAQALAGPRTARPRFIAAPLAPPDEPGEEVRIDDLHRFFRNPCAWFLADRLRLRLGEDLQTIDDREPVGLGSLESWSIGDQVLAALREDRDLERVRAAVIGRGGLPPGTLGAALLDEIAATAAEIHAAAAPLREDDPTVVPLDVETGAGRLVGSVEDVHGHRVVLATYSRPASRLLRAWVDHLAVSAANPGAPVETVVVGRGDDGAEEVRYPPLADDPAAAAEVAQERLGDLLGLLARGRLEPLAFFPRTSREYAEQRSGGKEHDDALAVAASKWERNEYSRHPGECEDEHVAQVYGWDADLEEVAADGMFAQAALAVWGAALELEEQLT